MKRLIWILLYVFSGVNVFSQTDSIAPTLITDSVSFKLRLNVIGGLVINRSFSHYSSSMLYEGTYGKSDIDPSQDRSVTRYGFMAGLQFSLTRKGKAEFILGINVSDTRGRYYFSEYFQPKSIFPNEYRRTETGYYSDIRMVNLNYESGARIKVYKGVSLYSAIVVHQNITAVETRKGQVTKMYWSEYPEPAVNYYERNIENIDQKNRYRSNTIDISLKAGVEYAFNIRKIRTGVFIHRNFGITAVYPWWISGVMLYLKQ